MSSELQTEGEAKPVPLGSIFTDSQIKELQQEYEKMLFQFEAYRQYFCETSAMQIQSGLAAVMRGLLVAGQMNDALLTWDRWIQSQNYNNFLRHLNEVRQDIETSNKDLAHNTRIFLQRQDQDLERERAQGGRQSESFEEMERRHKHETSIFRGMRNLYERMAKLQLNPALVRALKGQPREGFDNDTISDVASIISIESRNIRRFK